MNYTPEEVLQYVREEDVKFLRMAFCDVYGKRRNIAIMAEELPRAFTYGIAIDASAIDGFGGEVRSDLLLHPDPSTLTLLPWRPQQGKVMRMVCDITRPDGTPFEGDTRRLLKEAVIRAAENGYSFFFGAEMEFYLFLLDEYGAATKTPCDWAGYMDVAPEDKGENIRREVCLTLEQMGIHPESSHHESGPGQNEIDFRYADALTASDQAVLFRSVVKTIAAQNGLWAEFGPRPLPDHDGNGMHINLSARYHGEEVSPKRLIPGLMGYIREMTLFLNPTEESYARLGRDKAPAYVTWSEENRSQLIRLPAAQGEYRRLELRSPDSTCNPYLAYALLIHAALDGLLKQEPLPEASDFNTFTASQKEFAGLRRLPASLEEAKALAEGSDFICSHIPQTIRNAYCDK